MTSKQIIYQVDAFTSVAFKGNPAGVCITDHEPLSAWMQNIAMEMNLSETAFVFPGPDGCPGSFLVCKDRTDRIPFSSGFKARGCTPCCTEK